MIILFPKHMLILYMTSVVWRGHGDDNNPNSVTLYSNHELLNLSLKKISLLVELNFKIGDQNLERLVKAMAQSDILSYRQQKFTKNLFLFVILPIITKPCKLEDKEMSIILKINDKCKNSCHFTKISFEKCINYNYYYFLQLINNQTIPKKF